jgi:hypothetical protein
VNAGAPPASEGDLYEFREAIIKGQKAYRQSSLLRSVTIVLRPTRYGDLDAPARCRPGRVDELGGLRSSAPSATIIFAEASENAGMSGTVTVCVP